MTTASAARLAAHRPSEGNVSLRPLRGSALAARYEELEAGVLPNIDEPKGYPADLEPYFAWMERKATDRDAVEQARDDAFNAAHGSPEWTAQFEALLQAAQPSGEGTAWDACRKFLRIKNDDTWQDTLRKARDHGRRADDANAMRYEVTARWVGAGN